MSDRRGNVASEKYRDFLSEFSKHIRTMFYAFECAFM